MPERCVLIVAPHTSFWDFVWGWCFMQEYGLKVKFLIKQEVFFFPLGLLLKWLGGIPVDRRRGNNMVQQVVDAYQKHQKLCVVITPEGTRKPTRNWKKGFHHIARQANVPVAVGYVDYATKTYGLPLVFAPSDDFAKDMQDVVEVYQNRKGKYPEMFLLPHVVEKGRRQG